MSETTVSLRGKIDSAAELQSVVRTMKAMAASGIGQYEAAVRSLDDYYRTVQLGLSACFRELEATAGQADSQPAWRQPDSDAIGAVVFGSDQGLVGQFNDVMADFVIGSLAGLPGKKTVWSVGQRVAARLAETELVAGGSFALPNSISAISSLVGEILTEIEVQRERHQIGQIFLFFNRPQAGASYAPVQQRLLPLDRAWRNGLIESKWPSACLPEVMRQKDQTMRAFVREFLFVSLFRACAESLASENASRLAAMQRADKNIEELLEDLKQTFHRLRQSGIDEELFDVVSGFEALGGAG